MKLFYYNLCHLRLQKGGALEANVRKRIDVICHSYLVL